MPPPAAQSPIAPVFNDDLSRVQTVVEAAGGAAEVGWAAAVVVMDEQRHLVVTSDRGRGWMSAGAVLPAEAVSPWSHPLSARWVGIRDPARVIVEYAAAAGGQIAALASTHSSAPPLAAGVPWAFAGGTVQAHPELLGGLVITRFELQVPAKRRSQVAEIVDPVEQRQRALWVAVDAEARVGALGGSRSAVLAELAAHPGRVGDLRWVNSLDWGAVEAGYRDLRERERAARVDVRDVAVGAVDTRGAGSVEFARALAAEAVLALRHPVALSALQDAVYAWTRLLEMSLSKPVSPIKPIEGEPV
jgi:hypothetical protein